MNNSAIQLSPYNRRAIINDSLEPTVVPDIKIAIPTNDPVDNRIRRISLSNFALTQEGLLAAALPIAAAATIYLAPGIIGWAIDSHANPLPGVLNTAQSVVKTSSNFFYSFFVPDSWTLIDIGSSLFHVKGTYFLLKKFIVDPYVNRYVAWKNTTIENMMIPDQFHEDETLSKYTCPITQCPIRFPVKDPYGRHWEESVIHDWLSNHSTCPVTRRPLTASDLVFDQEVYNEITARLRELGHNN